MNELDANKGAAWQYPFKLFRLGAWINPFYFTYNNKNYEVANIKLYDATGVLLETERGWFSSLRDFNNTCSGLSFELLLEHRVKERFDNHVAYFLSHEEEGSSRRTNKQTPEVDLYLPFDLFRFHTTTTRKPSLDRTKTEVYQHFIDKQRNIKITKHSRTIHTPNEAKKFKLAKLRTRQTQLAKTQGSLAARIKKLEAQVEQRPGDKA